MTFTVGLVLYQPTNADVRAANVLVERHPDSIVLLNDGLMPAAINPKSQTVALANAGTAGALAELRARCESDWLMLLDQDSRPDEHFLVRAEQLAATADQAVGILAPVVWDPRTGALAYSSQRIQRRPRTPVISGALIRSDLIAALGDLTTVVPLDGLDFWIALEAQRIGLGVEIVRDWHLAHVVGEKVSGRWGVAPRVARRHAAYRYRLMGRATRSLCVRFGLRFPVWTLRHVAARMLQLLEELVLFGRMSPTVEFLRGILSSSDAQELLDAGRSNHG